MTSLALLFAILSVNPAPFCVLDEVDAALDEANTKKFLKIIDELAHSTQFIFITHNRETMKSANTIYGITMDETHASKLLSIKLSEAEKVVKKK
jgi:chromosome segregation protein